MEGQIQGGRRPARRIHATPHEVGAKGSPPSGPGAIPASRYGVGQNRPAKGFVEGLMKLWGGRTAWNGLG